MANAPLDPRPAARVVAVSASSKRWDGAERVRLHVNYVRSLERAGLVPLIVPPLATPNATPNAAPDAAAAIMDRCDGLVLTGGEDVDPARYGAIVHGKTGAPHMMRDATELALFEAARARRIPVLGICRGIQIINVALGGTLVQDLPSERPSDIHHDQPDERGERTHAVNVVPDTRLAAALGATALRVNSYHHQSIDRIGAELMISAKAPDGIVEAVETLDPAWWMVAVQWHPEDLTTDPQPWDRGLFDGFAGAIQG